MVEITIGQVAGVIALGVFIVRVWIPTQLAFILSGLLEDKETAATWTVASRSLQNSYWPDILRTDPAHSHGVKKSVQFTTALTFAVALLCAIAGVVTPLGLYDELEPAGTKSLSFAYVKDTSPFGISTPPRSPLAWSRTCSQGHGLLSQGPVPCPYSNTTIIYSWDGETFSWDMPYGNNVTINDTLRDIFSSGTRDAPSTVSNFFDIEWRQYNYVNDRYKNNGSTRLVGGYRPVTSVILNDRIEIVEGLVADAESGRGVGFRNHTLPVGLKHGGTWSEDLLFIEPESSCVDTNLSIEFTYASGGRSGSSPFLNLSLVDNGGFYNLNTTYPYYDHDNAQLNPDLEARAYKAAYLNNVYTMAYLNVTPINDPVTGKGAFAYMNSSAQRTFPLEYNSLTMDYNTLQLSHTFGDYLKMSGFLASSDGLYPNPFNISQEDFGRVFTSCTGATSFDLANSSNIYVTCGLMRGVPRRLNPGPPALFEGGSSWSTPLYACASTVRATIKAVSFLLNDTSTFPNFSATNITTKTYTSPETTPLWGFEETGLTNDGISPLWGLVSPAYESYPNISTFRKPSLYLPGDSGQLGGSLSSLRSAGGLNYVPGSDFPAFTMNTVFEMGSASGPTLDYTGADNMALYLKWQALSQTAAGAAQIINLVWTDLATSAVAGSKGVLGSGNSGEQVVRIEATQIQQKIKYHIAFAIPAFVLAGVLLVIGVVAGGAWATGRAGRSTLRRRLHQASTGRILVASVGRTGGRWTMGGKEWSRRYGKVEIGMGDEGGSGEDDRECDVVPSRDGAGEERKGLRNTALAL